MQRYFVDQFYPANGRLVLPAPTAHHLVTVMRAQPGMQVEIVLNDSHVYRAKLLGTAPALVMLNDDLGTNSELPVAVTLACGLPKRKEKRELIVQKSTELGVQRLIFFGASRSIAHWQDESLNKKLSRLQKIANEAAEQSHRNCQPQVGYVQKLATVLTDYPATQILVAYEEAAKQGETTALGRCLQELTAGQSLLVIFGPEGGLTQTEVAQVVTNGGIPVGLGPRILRTETAPLYLMAAISYQLELLQ